MIPPAYCERTTQGLLGEPLNVASNLVILAAAWAVWRLAHRSSKSTHGVTMLVWLIVAIGLGSALFHMLATGWALAFDAGPIFLFEIAFVWLYGRSVARFTVPATIFVLVAFLAALGLSSHFHRILNGSLSYAPSLVLLLAFAFVHHQVCLRERFALFFAWLSFAAAAAFRTVDLILCPCVPCGTHFLWHVFTGVMLYLLMRGMITNMPERS